MTATFFLAATSYAVTVSSVALATYTVFPSGVTVNQYGSPGFSNLAICYSLAMH